jgi:hypothetical protein
MAARLGWEAHWCCYSCSIQLCAQLGIRVSHYLQVARLELNDCLPLQFLICVDSLVLMGAHSLPQTISVMPSKGCVMFATIIATDLGLWSQNYDGASG